VRFVGFRRLRENTAAYMAYRHALAHAVTMGTHHHPVLSGPIPDDAKLAQITIHAWSVADRTAVTAVGVYQDATQTYRRNLGADMLDYRLLDLPSLGQMIHALGDEVRAAWWELSSPK